MDLLQKLIQKLNEAAVWSHTVELKRNAFLKMGGTTDTNLYLIKEGSIRIYFTDDFEEQVIRLAYPGNLIGSLDSFVTGQSSDLFFQAIKKAELLVAHKSAFDAFVESEDENKDLWLQCLQLLVVQQMEREKDILTTSPVERYKRVLRRSPQLFQEIPAKHIASYLRMTPETLSRIRKVHKS